MFFSGPRDRLRASEAENLLLEQANAALQERIRDLEAEQSELRAQTDALRRERTVLSGVFASLGSFGDSLGGVRESFLGLAGTLNQEKTSALEAAAQSDTSRAAFERIAGNLHATFERYESLFEVLTCDEAYDRKPISLRHPLIFYFGHTATFFINKFMLAGLIEQRIDPRLESMFAVGVDEMSWDDLDDARYDWPSVAEVAAYRGKVRAVVERVIRDTPFTLPIGWKDPFWAVVMGIEQPTRWSTSPPARSRSAAASTSRSTAGTTSTARTAPRCRPSRPPAIW